MTWWGWVLVGVAIERVVVSFVVREFRLWRAVTRDFSPPVRKGQKKAPAEAEARTGVEYGGTRLP